MCRLTNQRSCQKRLNTMEHAALPSPCNEMMNNEFLNLSSIQISWHPANVIKTLPKKEINRIPTEHKHKVASININLLTWHEITDSSIPVTLGHHHEQQQQQWSTMSSPFGLLAGSYGLRLISHFHRRNFHFGFHENDCIRPGNKDATLIFLSFLCRQNCALTN